MIPLCLSLFMVNMMLKKIELNILKMPYIKLDQGVPENLAKTTCKNCDYLDNCAGGCMGQVVNETGDLMGKCEDNCKIVKYLGERIERNGKLHPAFPFLMSIEDADNHFFHF